MFRKQEIGTDNRDLTLKEWPRRAESIDLFDKAYQKTILVWLHGRSLTETVGIHIPAQSLIRGSYAAAALCDGSAFLILTRNKNGIEEHRFLSENVIAAERQEILLCGQMKFTYMHAQKLSSAVIQYNASQNEIMEPLLSAALGNSLHFDIHQASLAYPRPEELFHKNYALYNYAADGAQFKAMHSYRIVTLHEKKRLFHHAEPGTVLIAHFDEGMLVIIFHAEKQDVREYFFRNASAEEQTENDEIRFVHKETSEILLQMKISA